MAHNLTVKIKLAWWLSPAVRVYAALAAVVSHVSVPAAQRMADAFSSRLPAVVNKAIRIAK